MTEAQDGAFIRHAPAPQIQTGKLTAKLYVLDSFFHGGVGQAKPLLQEVNAQEQNSRIQREACLPRRHMQHDLHNKVYPGNNAFHFFQKVRIRVRFVDISNPS